MIKNRKFIVLVLVTCCSLTIAQTTFNEKPGCAGARLSGYKEKMAKRDFWGASIDLANCELIKDGNDYAALRRSAERLHYENEIAVSKNDPARKYSAVERLLEDGHSVDPALIRGREKFLESVRQKASATEKKYKKSQGVLIGMTEADVLDSMWGKPRKINRTTRASGESAQWVYDGGYLYFENGRLTAVQH